MDWKCWNGGLFWRATRTNDLEKKFEDEIEISSWKDGILSRTWRIEYWSYCFDRTQVVRTDGYLLILLMKSDLSGHELHYNLYTWS